MNKWADHPGFISTRYPWTYAADCLRVWAGYGEGGTKLSRADASRIIAGISEAIGVGEKELAGMVADYYLKNEDDISAAAVEGLMRTTFAGAK
ncbi:hypothetical protein M0Q28_07070 [Patescibacteria group bacterium]|jgi:hypothetical protein|nr:hypothetical protein [Patescibacteria group bacterium]